VVGLVGALVLSACGSDEPLLRAGITPGADIPFPAGVQCASGEINAAGSSAQNNAMTAWIARYQQECPGATINYQPTGSGAGIEAFIGGQVTFAGSDAALAEGDEQEAANARCGEGPAINLPMVVGPVAVAYNLEGVENLLLLTVFFATSINYNPFSGPQVALPQYVYDEAQRGLEIATDRAWAAALTLILIVMLLNVVARAIAYVKAPSGR
jgi:hypothetical protein